MTLPFTAAQLVAKLESQKGVRETPAFSNVQPYSKALGHGAEPWCADFIGWGWVSLGGDWRGYWHQLGTDLYSYVPAILAAGRAHGLEVPLAQARPGDLLIETYPDENGTGKRTPDHIETATSALAGGVVWAVGGNTIPEGETWKSAGGGQVVIRRRYPTNVLAVLRPPYAAPKPPTAPAPHPAPAPAPHGGGFPTLRQGVTSAAVFHLQLGLRRMFPAYAYQLQPGKGPVSLYGPLTHSVVAEFQRRSRLPVTGTCDTRTWLALARYGIRP